MVRAFGSHPRGHRFEPYCLHQNKKPPTRVVFCFGATYRARTYVKDPLFGQRPQRGLLRSRDSARAGFEPRRRISFTKSYQFHYAVTNIPFCFKTEYCRRTSKLLPVGDPLELFGCFYNSSSFHFRTPHPPLPRAPLSHLSIFALSFWQSFTNL